MKPKPQEKTKKATDHPTERHWREMNRKQRRETMRKIQSEDLRLEVVHPDAAGIDIGNESHYVAVPPTRDSQPVRRLAIPRRGYSHVVGFVADINARGIGMYHFQAEVIALDLPHGLSPLLAVHLMPVARLSAARVFCGLFLWLGLHANLSTSNSTRPGPVGENYSISPAGSGRHPFQGNTRHHTHNRQYRSHAQSRAGTL